MSASSFDRVQATLRELACDIGAAECHGILCGMLCVPGVLDRRTWLAQVSGQDEFQAFESGAARAVFEALVADTRDAFGDGDLGFSLLLPADDVGLGERTAAFAAWCRGFLVGLALAGVVDLDVLGEDAREFLADLERFGRLASGDGSDEEDERALIELTEFTRVGVMIVYEDLAAGRSEPPILH